MYLWDHVSQQRCKTFVDRNSLVLPLTPQGVEKRVCVGCVSLCAASVCVCVSVITVFCLSKVLVFLGCPPCVKKNTKKQLKAFRVPDIAVPSGSGRFLQRTSGSPNKKETWTSSCLLLWPSGGWKGWEDRLFASRVSGHPAWRLLQHEPTPPTDTENSERSSPR